MPPSQPGAGRTMTGGTGPNRGTAMSTGAVSMNHRFVVRIDHQPYDLGTWQTASGLSVKWARCEYRTGAPGNRVVIWPGAIQTYNNVKLARAACSESETVQRWLAKTATQPESYSGAIQLTDWRGDPMVQWVFDCLFPVGWEISGFNASDGKPAIETLELAHTGFLRTSK
jgi:phage tail-like protein